MRRARIKLIYIVYGLLGCLAIGYMYWDTQIHDTGTGGSSGGNLAELLIVGTDPGFKPFEYKEGQQIVGFDIDLSRQIAKDLGKRIKVEEMAFDGLLPALQAGRIDMIIAGMTVTPDRAKNAAFSDPYYSATQRVMVRRDHQRIKTVADLAGTRIGVQLGTTGDNLAHGIQGAQVVQLPSTASVAQEISAGKIDAGILDDGPATQYLATNPHLMVLPQRLSSEDYAIALRKSDTTLRQQINKSIATMKQDGRYQQLMQKYFGARR